MSLGLPGGWGGLLISLLEHVPLYGECNVLERLRSCETPPIRPEGLVVKCFDDQGGHIISHTQRKGVDMNGVTCNCQSGLASGIFVRRVLT